MTIESNKKYFIISILGNSNVGKSTLFNKLTLTNDALITHTPGVTIDYKDGLIANTINSCICIDTPSYDLIFNHENIANLLNKIIIQSNIILFLVDNQLGLTNYDYQLASFLFSFKKKILLVINKVDNYKLAFLAEFWNLKIKDIYPISAYYQTGITFLLNDINKFTTNIKNNNQLINNNLIIKSLHKFKTKITVIGSPNVGKSTLINTLINNQRMIINNMPGTTHDSISIPIKIFNEFYLLYDTAGIKKKNKILTEIEKLSILKTYQTIKATDIVIFIIDANQGVTKQDLYILNILKTIGKSIIILINKWDLINKFNKKLLKEEILDNLKLYTFCKKIFISAKYKLGLTKFYYAITKITKFLLIKPLTTPILTKILIKAINNCPIICNKTYFNKKLIKLQFAHIGNYNPIKIIIHGKYTNYISNNYKKYLEKFFYYNINTEGIQIQIIFKDKYIH